MSSIYSVLRAIVVIVCAWSSLMATGLQIKYYDGKIVNIGKRLRVTYSNGATTDITSGNGVRVTYGNGKCEDIYWDKEFTTSLAIIRGCFQWADVKFRIECSEKIKALTYSKIRSFDESGKETYISAFDYEPRISIEISGNTAIVTLCECVGHECFQWDFLIVTDSYIGFIPGLYVDATVRDSLTYNEHVISFHEGYHYQD